MRRSLSISLTQAGYRVSTASSAEEAETQLETSRPDLMLLDIGLPGMDGLEALRTFRRRFRPVPTIFVTARRRELDEIVGLELGADDYIAKPFDMDVLLAHVRAVLRRSSAPLADAARDDAVVEVGDLSIDPAGRTVEVGGRSVALSPKEFDLLLLLARNAGRVLSLDEMLREVWGEEWVGETQTLYVHIRWLREKIEADPGRPTRLLTVRGAGYKLVRPEAES
jgi:DNA-binding response OmpR family regulator